LRAQQINQMPAVCLPASQPGFTPKQGQYLAFIHAYTLVLGRPPAEADLQRHFRVTPPSVHKMVLTLERAGLIRRQPGIARSIAVLVNPEALPPLRPSHDQSAKSSVQRY
jgi:DNA-binding MarR family transcriptional regulator